MSFEPVKGWEPAFDTNSVLLQRIYDRIVSSKVPVYPKLNHVFRALEYTRPEDVKVVLLGLDPYHQPGQAIGFSFAVNRSCKTPPSLRNIMKELESEGYSIANNQITRWIKKGVLLLNAYLTVEHGKSKSFTEWYMFTLDLLKLIDRDAVFLLLGKDAQSFIPELRKIGFNKFVTAAHPSPLSAHNGFFGSNCFKKVQKLIGGEFTWDY